MNYMKLIKLLYLVDREALRRWGRPVTTDCFVSMDRGPVLSEILDRINHGSPPNAPTVWSGLISEPSHYSVALVSNGAPPDDELSQAEEHLIDDVFAAHGGRSPWALVDFVHQLPEWKDPHGSAIPIEYGDVLSAVGKTELEIEQIENELASGSALDRLLAPS